MKETIRKFLPWVSALCGMTHREHKAYKELSHTGRFVVPNKSRSRFKNQSNINKRKNRRLGKISKLARKVNRKRG